MPEVMIPFNRSSVAGNELAYMAEAVAGEHISGDGPFSRRCHELLERELGIRKAFLTTSCTHALEMSALLLQIQPGDEVIVPSFTFVSTANAYVLHGARPVFADIRRDTLNLDENQLAEQITPRTKAIVPVHYGGVGCHMDAILEIAGRHGIAVVEDNAHGLFGKYQGRMLGTFGCMATLSFHESKNFTCGEGGALLVNDPQYLERAEIIREKGTNRSRLFRGEVNKYTWMDIGSSYLPSDMLAGFLYGQLEARDVIQSSRRRIWEYYYAQLQSWAMEHNVRLPMVPDDCEHTSHVFYLIMPSPEDRQALIAYLRSHGIYAVFHYLPLHLSEMGRKAAGKTACCPVTEEISSRLIRLPLFYSLTREEQERIIDRVTRFY